MIYRATVLAAVLAAVVRSAAGAAEGSPPELGLPITCQPGATCWVVYYVDLDPGEGVRDYTCGEATYNEPPHDRHQGVDFAIRDLGVMAEGVPVRAATAGTVVGVRDGMDDINVRDKGLEQVKGRECGNAVRLSHGGDWFTQYCHLRRGSVTVGRGETVAAGDILGYVGLSGMTEFPHVHFQVNHGTEVVDPFVGLSREQRCGLGERPLWRPEALAQLPYRPTALYNGGIAPGAPDESGIRSGKYRDPILPRTADALVLWVDMFHVRAGDRLTFRLFNPQGDTVLDKTATLPKDQVRRFQFAGVKRPGEAWPAGTYRGEALLTRDAGGAREDYTFPVSTELR